MIRHFSNPGTAAAAALMLLAALFGAARPAFARTGYPKVLNYFLSNEVTPAQIQELARWDALILDADFDWENPGAIAQLRSLNPDILIFGYIPSNGALADGAGRPHDTVLYQQYAGIEDGDFWLYAVDGTRVEDWPGKWSANMTPNSPVNSLGETYAQWFARFVWEVIWKQGASHFDGVCLDDVWDDISWLNAAAPSPIDSDRDGIADTAAQLDAWWKATNAEIVNRIRQYVGPNVPLIANGANSIFGTLNGTMLENFPYNGPADQDNPYGYSWNKWMVKYSGSYFTGLASYNTTPLQSMIINTHWSSGTPDLPDRTGRYEAHKRLCLGSTLLGDGYFSLDLDWDDHDAIWWEPEYDYYIGDPVGPAYSYPLGGQAIWRRDFTDATVVVNPNNAALAPEAGIPAIGAWDAYIGPRIYDPPPVDETPPAEITSYWGWANNATSATFKFWSVGDDGMVGRADHYLVRYSTERINSEAAWDAASQAVCDLVPKWPGIPETLIVNGLTPATTYFFAARAVDDMGLTSPIGTYYYRIITLAEDPPGGDVTPPSAITSLAVTGTTWQTASLHWSAPGDDGSLGVAVSYDGRIATFPITDANWFSAASVPGLPSPFGAGTSQSATLTGLTGSTTYYLSLKAIDDAGNWSPLGNVVSFTTGAPPDLVGPEPVTDLAVVSVTGSGVTLGFTAPADAVNPVTAYQVRYVVGSSFPDAAWDGATPAPAALPEPPGEPVLSPVNGLAPGTTYAFRVRSRDLEFNYSALSNVAVGTTTTGDVDDQPPHLVDDLAVLDTGETWLQVGFTAPADQGGGSVVSWEIRIVSGESFPDAAWDGATPVTPPTIRPAGSSVSCTVSDLAPATTWCLRARSTDDSGNVSDLGNVAVGATASPPPPPDTTGPAAVADFRSTGSGMTFLALAFTAPADGEGSVSQYEVRRVEGTSFPDAAWDGAIAITAPPVAAPGTTVEFLATSLAPSTTWVFRMRARDDSGNWSALSNGAIATTSDPPPPPPPDTLPPNPVADLAIAGATESSLALGFTTPADEGGGTVVSFELRRVTGAAFPDAAWDGATPVAAPGPGATGTAHVVAAEGLGPETVYAFRIRAWDGSGNASALSAAVVGTTAAAPPPPDETGPAAVVDLRVTGSGETWIDLAFTAPADAEGTVAAYDLRRVTGTTFADAAWSGALPIDAGAPAVPGTTVTLRVNGLVAATSYAFRLRSSDDSGNPSALGNTATGTTQSAPPPPPNDTTPPAAVTDLAATFLDSTTVLVTWTATGDDGSTGQATAYDLRWRIDAIDAATWPAATTVTGLARPAVAGAPEGAQVFALPAPATVAFAIVVEDEAGNRSGMSNVAAVELPDPEPPDTTPPLPVVEVIGVIVEDRVRVGWTPSSDADLSHYRLYRSRGEGMAMRLYRDQVEVPEFTDEKVVPGRTYCYQVSAVDGAGNESSRSQTITVIVPQSVRVGLPVESFGVGLAAPNPSTGPVSISVAVDATREIRLDVLDLRGRLIRSERMTAAAGESTIRWDGRDASGREVSRGIYWIRVRSDAGDAVRRVLIRR